MVVQIRVGQIIAKVRSRPIMNPSTILLSRNSFAVLKLPGMMVESSLARSSMIALTDLEEISKK